MIFFKQKKMSGGVSIKLLVLIVLVCAVLPIAIFGWLKVSGQFLDFTKPTISLENNFAGIGLNPNSCAVKFSDSSTGLKKISIKLRQGAKVKELVGQALNRKKEELVNISFSGAQAGLEEGEAFLDLSATDAAIWSNKSEKTVSFKVDLHAPELSILAQSPEIKYGGSGLVFFKLAELNPHQTVIKVGKRDFTALPARGLVPEMSEDNLFVGLFGLPLSDASLTKIEISATDIVGNSVTDKLNIKIFPASLSLASYQERWSDEGIEKIIAPIAAKNYDILIKAAGTNFPIPNNPKEKNYFFAQLVNTYLRNFDSDSLDKRLAALPLTQNSRSGFDLDLLGEKVHSFAQRINFVSTNDIPLGSLVTKTELRNVTANRNNQKSVNSGVVILSENFGIYGLTVGLDHGLGLSSIYANLESTNLVVGQKIGKSEDVGVSGKSGLNNQTQLSFEMRVQGLPVDPSEWRDEIWVRENIDNVIKAAKRQLGIPIYTKLEK